MEVDEAVKFLRVNLKGIRCTEPHRIANLLESMESENKALKKFRDMWEWIQGVEMWNKEYEKIVKEVVQDIEVGYESGKVIEKIGYEKVEDKGLDDGIFNKQNQRYIKKINTFKKLKQENEAYKEMWKMLSGIANRETDTSFESELFRTIKIIENHYLGGGE
jgi:hypothetical protein